MISGAMMLLGTLTNLGLDGDDDHIAVVDHLPQREKSNHARFRVSSLKL
jgi:hypothetical protein